MILFQRPDGGRLLFPQGGDQPRRFFPDGFFQHRIVHVRSLQ
jgi:hypothetical protein